MTSRHPPCTMRRCGVQMMTAAALRMLLNSPAVVGGAVSLWYTRGLCVVCMCGDVTNQRFFHEQQTGTFCTNRRYERAFMPLALRLWRHVTSPLRLATSTPPATVAVLATTTVAAVTTTTATTTAGTASTVAAGTTHLPPAWTAHMRRGEWRRRRRTLGRAAAAAGLAPTAGCVTSTAVGRVVLPTATPAVLRLGVARC